LRTGIDTFAFIALCACTDLACGRTALDDFGLDDGLVLPDEAGVVSSGAGGNSVGSGGGPSHDATTEGATSPPKPTADADAVDGPHIRTVCPPDAGASSGTSEGGRPSLSFRPVAYLPMGKSDAPIVAIADMDHDGRNDVVTISGTGYADPNRLYVFYQNCNGDFAPAESRSLGEKSPFFVEASLQAADLNGDGLTDLLIGTYDGFETILQQADGTLGALQRQPIGEQGNSYSRFARAADFDNDGRTDILIVDRNGGALLFYRQRAAGGFDPPIRRGIDTKSITHLAVGDLNGDLLPDVVLYDGQGPMNNLTLALQDTPGHFGIVQSLTVPDTGLFGDVAIGDVTGDGRADLLAHDGDKLLYVYPQDAAGRLQFPKSYPTREQPLGMSVADVDGDGRNDVVMVQRSAGVAIWRQEASGALALSQFFSAHVVDDNYHPDLAAVGDVNSDGRPDIVAAATSGTAVLLQTGP
jgi:hypothetical protein